MVDIEDIPDFPGLPGQKPEPGAPTAVVPVAVVLVSSPLDRDYTNIALNAAAVDAYIAAEVAAARAYTGAVERWSPWASLDLPLTIGAARAYNYARITLPDASVWYAFLDVEYLNLTTTRFQPTADAWTTYGPGIGYSTVVRGHVAVAASASGDIQYCLEPEPFTPGDLVGVYRGIVGVLDSPAVLVVSATDLRADPFVKVSEDFADGTAPVVGLITEASGIITAGAWPAPAVNFPYNYGIPDLDDYTVFPYVDGTDVYRVFAFGAAPSTIDGVPAAGGAFVYGSPAQWIAHMSSLAHVPALAAGIISVTLIPGGSGAVGNGGPMSPTSNVSAMRATLAANAPTYHGTLDTFVDGTTGIGNLISLLGAQADWVKLRTAPYANVQIGDRLGSVETIDPQSMQTYPSIVAHVQGAYYPEPDVAAWIEGAVGLGSDLHPVDIAAAVHAGSAQMGRDAAMGSIAAPLSASRSGAVQRLFQVRQQNVFNTGATQGTDYVNSVYSILGGV